MSSSLPGFPGFDGCDVPGLPPRRGFAGVEATGAALATGATEADAEPFRGQS